jgi:hypothetical protein
MAFLKVKRGNNPRELDGVQTKGWYSLQAQ